MESPAQQQYPPFQVDSLYTPQGFEVRECAANDDFDFFDTLDPGSDAYFPINADLQAWTQQLGQEMMAAPGLSLNSMFSKPELPFSSPDQMFLNQEPSPPSSATEDLDNEELFSSSRLPQSRAKRQELPTLDTKMPGDTHTQRYGQITPPNTSKSPEAAPSFPAEDSVASAAGKRGRKPTAKSRKDDEAAASMAKPQKAPARKARKGAAAKSTARQQDADEEELEEPLSEESKGKRARFLERNRQAAFTCRQRKKLWAQELEQRHRTMERDNRELKAARESLQEEYRYLRKQLISHTTCNCAGAQEYIQRTSKFLEALGGSQADRAGALASSSVSASPAASGCADSAHTPAIENTLRASLSQLAADGDSSMDTALDGSLIDEPEGLELDGMTV